jgi:hypothetical protein
MIVKTMVIIMRGERACHVNEGKRGLDRREGREEGRKDSSSISESKSESESERGVSSPDRVGAEASDRGDFEAVEAIATSF